MKYQSSKCSITTKEFIINSTVDPKYPWFRLSVVFASSLFRSPKMEDQITLENCIYLLFSTSGKTVFATSRDGGVPAEVLALVGDHGVCPDLPLAAALLNLDRSVHDRIPVRFFIPIPRWLFPRFYEFVVSAAHLCRPLAGLRIPEQKHWPEKVEEKRINLVLNRTSELRSQNNSHIFWNPIVQKGLLNHLWQNLYFGDCSFFSSLFFPPNVAGSNLTLSTLGVDPIKLCFLCFSEFALKLERLLCFEKVYFLKNDLDEQKETEKFEYKKI